MHKKSSFLDQTSDKISFFPHHLDDCNAFNGYCECGEGRTGKVAQRFSNIGSFNTYIFNK